MCSAPVAAEAPGLLRAKRSLRSLAAGTTPSLSGAGDGPRSPSRVRRDVLLLTSHARVGTDGQLRTDHVTLRQGLR